ncbi:hypothetical protein VA7868_00036 [Vibrio aerogenes CECT 7868]|uniref:Uncharacterized protein n=1 Tax=Vibrio aerogenes CECT 7868 TaxID=1216006 RepID=A0A1M5U8J5_9VIBR|nr:hypothetical protein VA7868_00036 [Vibrio aerogenes CECT 7868]
MNTLFYRRLFIGDIEKQSEKSVKKYSDAVSTNECLRTTIELLVHIK